MSYETDMTGNHCHKQNDNVHIQELRKGEHCLNIKPWNSRITKLCKWTSFVCHVQ